jgi:hypothetical protein
MSEAHERKSELAEAISILERRRVDLCRLIPARALTILEDAEQFVGERGLLTLMPDSALPSLFGATHEEPYAPGKPGFGSYPKTKWWWGGALGDRPNVIPSRLHRGKTLFLSRQTAAIVDPLCRDELQAATAGQLGETVRRIVEHLDQAGPSLLDELKLELGLGTEEMRSARQKLETRGAVCSVGVRLTGEGGSHTHSSKLSRWDQLVGPSNVTTDQALRDLAVAGVHAAVIAPRAEVGRWFAWQIGAGLVDGLIAEGRLMAYGDLLALPEVPG